MKKSIVVVAKKQNELDDLHSYTKKLGFMTVLQESVASLEEYLEREHPMALMIDVDSIVIDNQTVNRLWRKSPQTSFLLISAQKAHPYLQEAIGQYVYACISKPLDLDEVNFWLKSILDDYS